MNEQYESSVIKILQANQTDLKNDLDRFERTLYRTELSNSKKVTYLSFYLGGIISSCTTNYFIHETP